MKYPIDVKTFDEHARTFYGDDPSGKTFAHGLAIACNTAYRQGREDEQTGEIGNIYPLDAELFVKSVRTVYGDDVELEALARGLAEMTGEAYRQGAEDALRALEPVRT